MMIDLGEYKPMKHCIEINHHVELPIMYIISNEVTAIVTDMAIITMIKGEIDV
jgi:hypothetical protein